MTAKDIDRQLRALADPKFQEGQSRFFQHEVDCYGVRTQALKGVVASVAREIRNWPPGQRNELMEELWRLGKLESGTLVCHIYRRFARQCGAAEFRLFERWIDKHVRNWAHTDGVASWLLAACIRNEPALREQLLPWTSARNRWKRRASAVALLQEGKAGRHLTTIFEVADRLIDERDDMVEKGVGWLLKETYPAKPREVVAFLLPRRQRASRTTLRYAAEKMSTADRARVLAKD